MTERTHHGRKTVVISTALDVEYRAVREHLAGPIIEYQQDGTIYQVGTFLIENRVLDVVLVQTGPGNTQAAVELQRAIGIFSPQSALSVGVAGGRKDVHLGDVVIADAVYDYEFGKVTKEYLPRIRTAHPSHRLLARARQLSRDASWQHRIKVMPEILPKSVIKPIATGGKVIADRESATARFLAKHFEDAAAVDMEAHGFLHCAHVNGVDALVIRGISDLLNGKNESSDERWQLIASRHAAACAFEILAWNTATV